MAIGGLPAITYVDDEPGLATLLVVFISDSQVYGEHASALPLAVRAMTYYGCLRFPLQHVTHGPAQAATFPFMHDFFLSADDCWWIPLHVRKRFRGIDM